MFKKIITFAVQARVVVLALSILLVIIGAQHVAQAPLDVFPEFAPPKIEIQTEAQGLSTEEVEALISMPLENALNGMPHMTAIRSKSVLGLSSVVLLLEPGSNLKEARQFVQERLAMVTPTLPALAKPPVMLQSLSSLSRVMKIGLSATSMSQMEMTQLALWTMRPKIMSIPGVANVAIWGQKDKQLQVLIDPDRLRSAKVTVEQVARATNEAMALDSGGFLDTPNQRLAVRYQSNKVDPAKLSEAIIDYRQATPVKIADVAQVQVGSPPMIGNAIINGREGLLLIVEKQLGANTLEVTRRVEAAIAEMSPALAGVHVDTHIFRPATFIERAIHNLSNAMLIGCLLVTLILFAFMRDKRAALISLAAIPLSLLAAVLVLTGFGVGLNTMVIAGLVIALGEVVDDAIIDVENIARRLKLNALLDQPLTRLRVVVNASVEVRSAVVFATLIVMIIFLPVLALTGIAGAFFKPLALAYIAAIAASLAVAMLITPALAYFLLKNDTSAHDDTRLAVWLQRHYRRWLSRIVPYPKKAMVIIAVSLAGAGLGSLALNQEFLPAFKETDFLMHFVERPGTSLEQMSLMTLRANKDLMSVAGVRNFGSHIGRAEVADEVVGPNFTELWISLDESVNYEQALGQIQKVMDGYAGIFTDVQTYLKERSKEVLTGTSASIVVRLFGPDLEVLRDKAHDIEAGMASIDGIADLKVESQTLVPQVEIRLKAQALAQYGLTAGQVRRITTTLLKGLKVGEIYENQRRIDVVIWGAEQHRVDLSAISHLALDTPLGQQVRLKDVADIQVIPMPNEIKREAASRRIDITANVKGKSLSEVAQQVESSVRAMHFPQGYYPVLLGEYQAQKEASDRLFGFGLLALIGIFLVLYSDFKSLRLSLMAFATLPFALVGSVIAVFVSGGTMSLGSVVGLVTVVGIAARNGIMLLSHYKHLEQTEGMPFGLDLVMRGAQERLLPILMTALATGLALLPLIISGNKPGHEIEYPLAIVIFGGLITSTILNLLLLPSLYLAFGKHKPAIA
ncbi:MAG: efflux RND transporter permease subunit [Methylophilus sp.]|uniref:efflux RND transporter permease subunit n=1 Tax=Methylophilus sp. TaxID=29541 RepID=UPI003FA0644B